MNGLLRFGFWDGFDFVGLEWCWDMQGGLTTESRCLLRFLHAVDFGDPKGNSDLLGRFSAGLRKCGMICYLYNVKLAGQKLN